MKKLVILGCGESGLGTALLAIEKGFKVFVSDSGPINDRYKQDLIKYRIDWEQGKHSESKICDADLVMKSPGISTNSFVVKQLLSKNIPVISEIEFASKFTTSKLICITGSNGKTTTAMMTYNILKEAGFNVVLAGNIGKSFASTIELKPEYFVLELSSFQLDGIINFSPHIAVITNITEDHLDRYDNKFENYVRSKFRIVMNQTEDDYLIYNSDDPVIQAYIDSNTIKPKLIPFSVKKILSKGVFLDNNTIKIINKKKTILMPTTNLSLDGKHNVKNAMAAATVANLLKIRKDTIRESLECFQGAEHRLEHFLKINKVQYINDSKATNVNATYYALESMNSPTVWIVGGVDKGNDYSSLYHFVNEKVKAIICLGKQNEKLFENFESMVETIVETSLMTEAVGIAYKIAKAGDNVLLSPACASFDLFESYEDRGQQFKAAVRQL